MTDEKSVIEINPNKEYILAADISGSMTSRDDACYGNSRYSYMLEKFKQFVQIAAQYDEHGAPTIIMFGENVYTHEHCDLKKIDELLDWQNFEAFTMLDKAIEEAFKIHKEEKREKAEKKEFHKGTVLMVFTDGEPTNKIGVYKQLENIVSKIDSEEEFQIIFVTVGRVSKEIDQFLASLHDHLEQKNINPNDFDIIHVEKIESVQFMKAIIANRHGDK